MYTKGDWWDKKVFWFLTRNDTSLIALALLGGYLLASTNWDFVFGLRP